MKLICLLLITLLVAPATHAAPASTAPVYDDYRAVLMGFVDENGLVDYEALGAQRAYLDDFVIYLASVDPKVYATWPREDQIAFWINAYNALTLRAIIDHYPINPATPNGSYPRNSIRQIPGVWDQARVTVMGESITLQYIETKYLRRDFNEPRFHLALVCAAMSCPKLRNEPYEGSKLIDQLDDQGRTFLADFRHFHMDAARQTVRVSEIFRWYADDFAAPTIARTDRAALERSAIVSFASKYLGRPEVAFLTTAHIEYAPYDWTLNEQPR